jgi:hypothetical protein
LAPIRAFGELHDFQGFIAIQSPSREGLPRLDVWLVISQPITFAHQHPGKKKLQM